MKKSPTIAFIGGGNMAGALLGGLLNAGWRADDLTVAEPDNGRRNEIARRFGVQVYADNAECAARADVVVFAVKPQAMEAAVTSSAVADGNENALVISIAAGVRCAQVARWLGAGGEKCAIVRAMPNTPAAVSAGMCGLFANANAGDQHRATAESILRAVGETAWVAREELLDVITAISGSGPAYFFKLMELLSQHATRHGIDRKVADQLAVQTAVGAAALAKQSSDSPATLREQVTSPHGTTEAALAEMDARGFDDAVAGGVDAAVKRAGELGE